MSAICQWGETWTISQAYIDSLELFTTQFLQQIIDLVGRPQFAVCENVLVDRPVINDDSSNVPANIAQVGQGRGNIAILDHSGYHWSCSIIDLSRGKTRVCNLVPPSHIDICVWKAYLFDVVVDLFFLLINCQIRHIDTSYVLEIIGTELVTHDISK